MTVVALAGGVGGAKLADGLAHLLGETLTVAVNTGDDFIRSVWSYSATAHHALQRRTGDSAFAFAVRGASRPCNSGNGWQDGSHW